jgi:TM2 domain-containing membrane protein YozV
MVKITKEKARAMKLYEMRKVSTTGAVLWSLLITGAGHWSIGKTGRGFAFLGLQMLLWIIMMGWIMWIFAPIDAYKCAKEINQGLMLELGLDEEE